MPWTYNASKDWTSSIITILHMASSIPREAEGLCKLYSSLIAEFRENTFLLALTEEAVVMPGW